MDYEQTRRALDEHLMLTLEVARNVVGEVRPGGTPVFMGGTGGRPELGLAIVSTVTVAMPALVANLALELAPIRVNLIAAGFVDTPLSASSSATNSISAAVSSAPRSRSDASSDQTTLPRSPYTS
jgi:NAD(P)-dependent dehydrogenase (short-subunit alcohol dehydrogenase family)